MEQAIALAGVYELQGRVLEALQIYKSILKNDPHHKQALQSHRRLSALGQKAPTKPALAKPKPAANLSQYAPLQRFQIQNMQSLFIQATSPAELQTIEEWLLKWN
ncbi:hypothetical protein [Helicobacter ailurogastricus]|uniref:Tetratricopeptide repeat protein n=1 Tax=Helicobacter ailurogastricus TaxID=1578720 RepID=A0A0K2X6F2_9HELI|nr:hypothetical protein [Helicobacter ailurogastricus]CRF41745.1 hypothetical protein HAL011_15600 [Helicobacter ailurogastricus]CRF42087.1 hypothetical protein HAL013_02430 [Helicobacter ailurogastricus]CRF44156.1 hypothetical protein HAL09_07280 [Helicobacter ailurogastricus]CRF52944.1 hypothetical protein HAL07_14090 [Helicobacter ailurogastricus]BDQ28407.1 hypothetical protein ASB7_02440 [Helicobacter ailurogastricus]